MTAEIAIMNRAGVALAADSALTVGKDRVWKSSNKLFQLTPTSDVAIMLFGSGEFCGIPWEVIIKQFRKAFGQKTLPVLQSYVDEFTAFVDGLTLPDTKMVQASPLRIVSATVDEIKNTLTEIKVTARRQQIEAELKGILAAVIEAPKIFEGFKVSEYASTYADPIVEYAEHEFQVKLSQKLRKLLVRVCFEQTQRSIESAFATGIVFAGYGDHQLLPSVIEIRIDGKAGGKSRLWTIRERDLNLGKTAGGIIPFAQTDIANLFVEGTFDHYLDYTEQTLLSVLNERSASLIKDYVSPVDRTVELARQKLVNQALVASFMSEHEKFRYETSVQELLNVVSSLPKEEMAAMAEALVEITSLRRKMDSKLETVGGPVDVAIVSKSDGFVWIKRKHYFDLALNPDFVQRRSRRYGRGSSDAED